MPGESYQIQQQEERLEQLAYKKTYKELNVMDVERI
jgi:hypothetical protein